MLPGIRNNEIDFVKSIFDRFNATGFPMFAEPDIKIAVSQEEGSYRIKAEMPGVKKEDIQIEFEEDHLILKAIKEESQQIEKENYLYKEITNGQVTRAIRLPGALKENIEAEYRDGILNMKVPIKERDDTNNKINIEIK